MPPPNPKRPEIKAAAVEDVDEKSSGRGDGSGDGGGNGGGNGNRDGGGYSRRDESKTKARQPPGKTSTRVMLATVGAAPEQLDTVISEICDLHRDIARAVQRSRRCHTLYAGLAKQMQESLFKLSWHPATMGISHGSGGGGGRGGGGGGYGSAEAAAREHGCCADDIMILPSVDSPLMKELLPDVDTRDIELIELRAHVLLSAQALAHVFTYYLE